jgi:hypothetical protein
MFTDLAAEKPGALSGGRKRRKACEPPLPASHLEQAMKLIDSHLSLTAKHYLAHFQRQVSH